MKIWTWLLPCELPSQAALDSILGGEFFLIEVYKECNEKCLAQWLCDNCTDTVLFVPQYGNPMETLEPYNIHYIYFKKEEDACHFRLRWG